MKLYLAGMSEQLFHKINYDPILLSYANQLRDIEKMFSYSKDIFVDSGAFSVFTRGISVDIDAYIDWINNNYSKIGVVAALDVIGDAESSWKNYIYMRENLVPEAKNKLLFTFHIDEPLSNLKHALQYCDSFGKLSYIGLGGMATKKTSEQRRSFLTNAFSLIPHDVKVHGFGMTDYSLLNHYNFYSVDSTTWLRAAAFGEICFNESRIKISEKHKYNPRHYSNLSVTQQHVINSIIQKFGFTLNDLCESTENRCIFNARYLINYCKQVNISNTKYKKLF